MYSGTMILFGVLACVLLLGVVTVWPVIGVLLFLLNFLLKAQLKILDLAPGYLLDFVLGGLGLYGAIMAYARTQRYWPQGRKWAKGFILIFLILFMLFIALYPFTRAPHVANRKLTWMLFSLGCVIIPALYLQTLKQLSQLITGYCLLAIPLCIISLKTGPTSGSAERLTFLMSNPLIIANFAGVASCLVLASAAYSKTITRKIWLLSLPLFAAVIFRSGSRGSLIAVPLAFLLLGMMMGLKSAIKSFLLLGGAGAGVFFIVLQGVDWFATRFSSEAMKSGMITRFDLWTRTLSGSFKYLPLIGGGPGDSTYILTGQDIWEGIFPHNPFIEVFSELGLVGLVLMLLIVWMVLKSIWSMRTIPKTSRQSYKGLYLLAAVSIYLLVMSMKSANYAGWFEGYFWFSIFLHAHVRFFQTDALALSENVHDSEESEEVFSIQDPHVESSEYSDL
jgi:O-antigen ligase